MKGTIKAVSVGLLLSIPWTTGVIAASKTTYPYDPQMSKVPGIKKIAWENEKYSPNPNKDPDCDGYIGSVSKTTDKKGAETIIQGCLEEAKLTGDWRLILAGPCLLGLDGNQPPPPSLGKKCF